MKRTRLPRRHRRRSPGRPGRACDPADAKFESWLLAGIPNSLHRPGVSRPSRSHAMVVGSPPQNNPPGRHGNRRILYGAIRIHYYVDEQRKTIVSPPLPPHFSFAEHELSGQASGRSFGRHFFGWPQPGCLRQQPAELLPIRWRAAVVTRSGRKCVQPLRPVRQASGNNKKNHPVHGAHRAHGFAPARLVAANERR